VLINAIKMLIANVIKNTAKGIPNFRIGDKDSSFFPNWSERMLLAIPFIAAMAKPAIIITPGEIVVPCKVF
jgi:hypothetical protein